MINEAFWGFDSYNGNKKEFNVIAVGAPTVKKVTASKTSALNLYASNT